jgi:Domain of unknown function (DUF2341)
MMKKLLTPTAILVTLLAALPFPLHAQSGIGWLAGWTFRSPVTINNSEGRTLSNFQVHVLLDGSFDFTKAKSNGSDIRFTAGDGITLIPFWIESWNAGNLSASIWVQAPSIPTTGSTIYMYYGNPQATSASNGGSTFDFFDDFQYSNSVAQGYFQLGSPQTELVRDQPWETTAPHTLSVLQTNSGGYAYWGYYGLQGDCGGVGLAFSNDLVTWTKSSANPLFTNGRWPSVLQIGGVFYMLYTKNYCGNSEIDLATSTDGIHFTDVKTIVPPNYRGNPRNQNPNLYFNSANSQYYIYWYSGNDFNNFQIMARSASWPTGLDGTSSEVTILSSTTTLAAPNMLLYNGTYFLSTEVLANGNWNVRVYSSTSPTSGFTLLPGNPVLADGSACMFQHTFGSTLHNYTCKLTNSTWTIEHRSADLTAGRLQSLDPTKWTPSGGSWMLVSDTRPDGSAGLVVEGSTSAHQILYSNYTGTDYVIEAYGKQLQGRVWGLGARVKDPNNSYSFNLYDDLNTGQNLWAYSWLNSNAITLGSVAVGPVSANTWYKLTAKVQGSGIDVYKDGVPQIHTSDATFPSGGVALYGETGTVANFSNVLVRKYSAIEPTTTLGPAQVPVSLSSLTLNPATVTGGTPSTGTVTLNGPAPSGGAVVSLSSNNAAVAPVPASVTVPAGATTTTFSVSTGAVAASTTVIISASYGSETSQAASLTVIPPILSSISLSPTSVTAGSSSTGTVTLNGPAPSGGSQVTLSSSNPNVAAVPPSGSVTVPAGATTATFTVTTNMLTIISQSVTISGTYNNTTQSAILKVNSVVPIL